MSVTEPRALPHAERRGPTTDPDALAHFIGHYARLFVITGAGCSTDSGIPDYRDAAGAWKRSPPVS